MRRCATAWLVMAAGPALAASPATVSLRAPVRPSAAFRLPTVAVPEHPTLRVDDPRSMLRTGFGGGVVDLFPFEGGKFHLSAGPRLFGRAGRPRAVTPENLLLLPAFRGPRYARRFSPALLVGYGRTVDRGLSFGVDAGMIVGRIAAAPDRMGRLNRSRADADLQRDGEGRVRDNEVVRATALYRF